MLLKDACAKFLYKTFVQFYFFKKCLNYFFRKLVGKLFLVHLQEMTVPQ